MSRAKGAVNDDATVVVVVVVVAVAFAHVDNNDFATEKFVKALKFIVVVEEFWRTIKLQGLFVVQCFVVVVIALVVVVLASVVVVSIVMIVVVVVVMAHGANFGCR